MSRLLSSALASAAFGCALFSGAALAGAPPAGGGAAAPNNAAVGPAAAVLTAAPTFDCHVTPQAPPAAGAFQATSYKITLKTGTLPKGKNIAVRLGIQPTGAVQTGFCSDGFGRGKTQEQKSVIVVPPVTDASYIWLCNAKITTDACDAPPAVPK